MENLFIFLATSLAIRRLSAPRKFKNCRIGNTGCTALVLTGNGELNHTQTRTGDDLYFHEYKENHVSYGLICIQLNKTYEIDAARELLSVYMNKLRAPFYITCNTGLESDEDWNQDHSASLVDYWQDKQRVDWKVKGYTDGRHMAVLYVKNIGQTDVNKQDLFLDSFYFGV